MPALWEHGFTIGDFLLKFHIPSDYFAEKEGSRTPFYAVQLAVRLISVLDLHL
jgi:hypothetical protein